MTRAHTNPWTLLPPVVALVGALALALAWGDVLPGGWRLRGLVEPHALAARREQARRSAHRLLVFVAENPTVASGAIAFLGSSTIERFPLETCFPGRPCLDRGIGNESARELVRRLEASLPAVPLGGVVLFAGRVELLSGELSAAEIRRAVDAVVSRLAELRPGVPVVLLGLPPARDLAPDEVERLDRANAELKDLALERGLRFVDTARAPMRDRAGSLPEALAADRLHLNDDGYRVLARFLLEDGGEVAARLR